jgi:hypothetical protein
MRRLLEFDAKQASAGQHLLQMTLAGWAPSDGRQPVQTSNAGKTDAACHRRRPARGYAVLARRLARRA